VSLGTIPSPTPYRSAKERKKAHPRRVAMKVEE
jgi:hypothetical protein